MQVDIHCNQIFFVCNKHNLGQPSVTQQNLKVTIYWVSFLNDFHYILQRLDGDK